MQVEFVTQYHPLFQEVISLGRKHSSTLGFMPEGGFIDHAQKRCIIIIHDKFELMGYLMFRVVARSSRISIVHLCIKDEFRGKSIPTKLLDALRKKYETTHAGIALSCRADYSNASALWSKYGFVCRGKVRSRSVDEQFLNKWWYDFNKLDLFSSTDSASVKIKALLDANIIVKLRDNNIIQEPSQDARPLMADWLSDEVDFYYAPELFNEISRDSDNERAQKTRNFLSNFIEARFDVAKCKNIASQLIPLIPGKTDNDKSDRMQLASAIESNVSYFITLDKGILDKRYEIAEIFDIQIYSPQEFILEIDQLINKEEYSPTRLAGVSFHTISKISNTDLDICVDKFLCKSNSEKKSSFQNIVYAETSKGQSAKIKVVKADNNTIAFFAYEYGLSELIIPFIRLDDTEHKLTLFMQLISDFIRKAIDENLSKVVIKETFLSENQISVLGRMGFENYLDVWGKTVSNRIIDSSQIVEVDERFGDENFVGLLQSSCKEERNKILLDIEHKLFPLKFSDLDIPCYIIPIKALWAGQLFDPNISGVTLFGADPNRIWSIENVYYRNTRPITELAPGRILWYVSSDKKTVRSQAIVASSYLDEVMTDKPKILFQKNKHFGIYEWKNIYKLCKKNIETPIRALRFSQTEVFKNPIKLQSVRQIFMANGRSENTFASPVKVGNAIFNQIYQAGREKSK